MNVLQIPLIQFSLRSAIVFGEIRNSLSFKIHFLNNALYIWLFLDTTSPFMLNYSISLWLHLPNRKGH